nr:hypothetical protein HK105_005937 [Polyrhizophydium stewartii]
MAHSPPASQQEPSMPPALPSPSANAAGSPLISNNIDDPAIAQVVHSLKHNHDIIKGISISGSDLAGVASALSAIEAQLAELGDPADTEKLKKARSEAKPAVGATDGRPSDLKLAIGALQQIHEHEAVHGDAYLGNVAFVGVEPDRRAFWFDLERTSFPPETYKIASFGMACPAFVRDMLAAAMWVTIEQTTPQAGGGAHFPYPKWVWTPYGGWWTNPKNRAFNSLVTGSIVLASAAILFKISAEVETRHRYPRVWIPSMLWSKEFHDPVSVAYWKEQLAKEGREWIEPIPAWWPFKGRQQSE